MRDLDLRAALPYAVRVTRRPLEEGNSPTVVHDRSRAIRCPHRIAPTDGLLYHESDLRIEEHYTDTAGFTDHVFAMMHLLGYRFAPRLRDLGDTKLYVPKGDTTYEALKPMIGGELNIRHIRAHWDEILRLATSIKQGTVTASLMHAAAALR